VTVVTAGTGLVDTVKVALVAAAATVTVAGTEAAAVLLLASATTTPPAGAALLSVTVPTELVPPLRLAGFSESAEIRILGGFTVKLAIALDPP
jgi:hypothetical protein